MTEQHNAPQLGLTEAYHVANRWLTHAGATPRAIEEPVDGIVELIGQGFHARIRIDTSPLGQGAVLAVIRAVEDTTSVRLVLFSVTGFTNGALVFADTQGVALFDLTAEGDVVPRNTHARTLLPGDPLEPAFAMPPAPVLDLDSAVVEEHDEHAQEGVSWKDCPRCGATHHHRSNFCASCGADLHVRLSVLGLDPGTNIPPPGKLESRGQAVAQTAKGQPVPRQEGARPTLRCRTCGSPDIELINPV
ncbi:MAG: hypothetical protein ACE5GC_01110 [Acidimicrobiia bacterium]